jgi:hypothetical protein
MVDGEGNLYFSFIYFLFFKILGRGGIIYLIFKICSLHFVWNNHTFPHPSLPNFNYMMYKKIWSFLSDHDNSLVSCSQSTSHYMPHVPSILYGGLCLVFGGFRYLDCKFVFIYFVLLL